MNYIQLGLFIVFVFSNLISGIFLLSWLGEKDRLQANRHVFSGEALLLGAIFAVGMIVLASILGLYSAPVLWATVLAPYSLLLHAETRKLFYELLLRRPQLTLAHGVFLLLMAYFFLRSCYFLVDVDSQMVYLYIQKLWLNFGTSIFADRGFDARIYVPSFDTVPAGLGISLFGHETFFAQLINYYWRMIVLLLVFGYATYRLGSWVGLAAVMLCLFNDHFFTSGANQWVLINGALIALLFAAVYNFWEARESQKPFRLLLGMIFLSQLMANKYQMLYILVLLTFVGILIQKDPKGQLMAILKRRSWVIVLVLAWAATLLWYLKNYLATGSPVFPVFAGRMEILGWTPEMQRSFMGVFRGLSLNEILKYLSYLYIWPGIVPAKYVWLTICGLPLIIFISILRNQFDRDRFMEICYWLSVSLLILVGTCLASHQDPRYFRFSLGIVAFASVLSIQYILRSCLLLRNDIFCGIVTVALALPGWRILFHGEGGGFRRPGLAQNVGVLFNKIHFDDVLAKHYPENIIVMEGIKMHPEKFKDAAYYTAGTPRMPSAFLLPIKPQVGLWQTTIVNWDSFNSKEKIVRDLADYGIKYVMRVEGQELKFLTQEEYADIAVKFNRYPETIFYPYEMPPELTRTKF